MDRRSFIRSGVVGIIASQAGCMGYSVLSTEKINQRKNKIESLEEEVSNKSSRINELESSITEKESRIEELETEIESVESDVSQLEQEKEELESDIEEARAKIILDLYSWGITLYNDGIDAWNDGTDYWDNENYSEARAEFNLAGGYWDSAYANFIGAGDRAEEFRFSQVESDIRETENNARLWRQAAANYQSAAAYAEEGQFTEAQNYKDTGDNRRTEAESYSFHNLDVLESELGVSLDI